MIPRHARLDLLERGKAWTAFVEKVCSTPEFHLCRHEAATAMELVYNLHPNRARTLRDRTVLEIRRTLLPITEIPKISLANLVGTRGHALAKYCDQLSAQDFAKLTFLMRGLPRRRSLLRDILTGLWTVSRTLARCFQASSGAELTMKHDTTAKRDRERKRLQKRSAKKRRKPISAAVYLSQGI